MPVFAYSRLGAVSVAAESEVSAAVRKTAADIKAGAQSRAPVDTGNLRSNIRTRSTGKFSAEVVANAPYSVYVEFGTSKMGAQPFMVPAAEAQRAAFMAMVKAAFS